MVTQSHYPQPAPPAQPAARRRKKPRRKQSPFLTYVIAIGGALLVGVMLVMLVGGALGVVMMMTPRVPDDVSVAGVAVANMAPDDAEARVRGQLANETLLLTDAGREWRVPLAQLGIYPDFDTMFAQMQDAVRGAQIPASYYVDLGTTQQGFVALSDPINIEAQPGEPGRVMEIPVMLDRLRADLAGEIGDGAFELSMMEVEPLRVTAANYTGEPTTHTVEPGQELALIAKEYGVSVADILALNDIADPDLLYIGQELDIPAPGVYEPSADEAPPAPTNRGKSIVVSTSDQRIYAYEDGELVRSHITSTGRAQTPTVKGDYNIYVKYRTDDMSGPDYFLPDVPFTMYFYQGYGIHGTYWHNSFGRPMSHGCVNLPIDEAEWFFNWANEGTPVRVI